jgi:hypothetical protein
MSYVFVTLVIIDVVIVVRGCFWPPFISNGAEAKRKVPRLVTIVVLVARYL